MAPEEKLAVTVPSAAALVEIARSTAYGLVASGEWPAVKIGRSIRVPVAALRIWLERRTQATHAVNVATTSESDFR